MELIIGNKNYSSWSLRPWLLLAESNLPFVEKRNSLCTNLTHSEITKYSMAGKVPILNENGVLVWDSLAICEYISEQYLEGRGWPEDFKARAEARSCCSEMHSGFFQIREQMPMNCKASNRHIEITEKLQKEISRIDNLWSKQIEKNNPLGPWLFGKLSIADCMFAPVVFRFSTYNVSLSQGSRAYMQTVLENQHIQKWLEESKNEIETIEIAEVGI